MQPFSSGALKSLPTKFLPLFTYKVITKPFGIPPFLEEVKIIHSYLLIHAFTELQVLGKALTAILQVHFKQSFIS